MNTTNTAIPIVFSSQFTDDYSKNLFYFLLSPFNYGGKVLQEESVEKCNLFVGKLRGGNGKKETWAILTAPRKRSYENLMRAGDEEYESKK